MDKVKLWVDDLRDAPDGFIHIHSANEFIRIWKDKGNDIDIISLDHDAGDYVTDGGDYISILDFLEMSDLNSDSIKFHIHSANPVGIANMRRIINKNGWQEIYTLN